jgi:predicted DNA-binding transcriptional regulator AlpA
MPTDIPSPLAADQQADPGVGTPILAEAERPQAGRAGPPPLTPLLVSTSEAATVCGISKPSWYRLVSKGMIGPAPIKLGGRVLYNLAELRQWTASRAPDGRLPGRREWQARRAAQHNGRRV